MATKKKNNNATDKAVSKVCEAMLDICKTTDVLEDVAERLGFEVEYFSDGTAAIIKDNAICHMFMQRRKR